MGSCHRESHTNNNSSEEGTCYRVPTNLIFLSTTKCPFTLFFFITFGEISYFFFKFYFIYLFFLLLFTFFYCYLQYTILTLLTLLTLLTILVPTIFTIIIVTYNTYVPRNITYSTIVTYIAIANITILCPDNFSSLLLMRSSDNNGH